jgi:hypothetical protein
MGDWIQARAAEFKNQQDEEQRRQNWRLHEAEVIRARGPEMVQELETVVRRDVDKWNATFRGVQDKEFHGVQQIVPSEPRGFQLHKRYFPSGTATVKFNPRNIGMDVELTRSRPIDGGEYETKSHFDLKLHSDDRTVFLQDRYGQHVTLDKMSQMLIESLAEISPHHAL